MEETQASNQSEGFVLGTIVCREILLRNEVPIEIVDLINHESLLQQLNGISSAELILQDQVVSGRPFDPDLEQKFQEMARPIAGIFDHLMRD